MATYKKRGYKPKKEKTNDALLGENAYDGESTTEEIFETLDETASKTEEFVEKNWKMLLGLLGLVLVGFIAYYFINSSSEATNERAANDIAFAHEKFGEALNAGSDKDSIFKIALNGDGNRLGYLDIINDYKGSKTANLAELAAGEAYFNIGDYKEAIAHLDKFSSNDVILNAQAKGLIGDAFVEFEKYEDALSYYGKAIQASNNNYTTPRYLLKAGVLALELGKKDIAKKYFMQLKNKFASSTEAKDVDLLIANAS
jgi:TolA-binding protein